MTGTQGAWVILIGLFLVAAAIGVSVLRRSS
jgi:LPXTG-motif cell wall-anchored protein